MREFPERLMPVGNQGFPDLLTRLGIQPQLVTPFWVLSNVITPVSIVDQNLDVNAVFAPFTYEIEAPGGSATNPAANTNLAATAGLVNGEYVVLAKWAFFTSDNADPIFLIKRNSADTADVWTSILDFSGMDLPRQGFFQVQVAVEDGERFVIRSSDTGVMTGRIMTSLWLHRVS